MDLIPTLQLAVALILGLIGGGGLAAWYLARSQKKVNLSQVKVNTTLSDVNQAQADDLAAQAWERLVRGQQLRVDKLEERIAVLEGAVTDRDKRIELLSCENLDLKKQVDTHKREIDHLRSEIDKLRDYMIENGLTPPAESEQESAA